MKKKIFLLFFIILIIFALQVKSNAVVSNNDYYTATLPNNARRLAQSDTDMSYYESYEIRKGSINYVTVSFHVYKSAYRGQYTQEEVDYSVNHFGSIYLQLIKGELTNVSGFSCRRIASRRVNMGNNWSELVDRYEVMTDRYGLTINIEIENWDDFLDSNEEREIINLFRVKTSNWGKTDLPFTDIRYTDWYYGAAKYTYQNKLISGYNDTTFGPEDKITRGMIVTILYRMEGMPDNDGRSFSDVVPGLWYSKAVKWASEKGIVHGYGGTNKFGPEDNIIRQDLAGILRNYAAYKKKDVKTTASLTKFNDYKSVDAYAKTSMEWAVGKGVITGNGDGTLNPKGNATRAEAAAMIQKYCTRVGR